MCRKTMKLHLTNVTEAFPSPNHIKCQMNNFNKMQPRISSRLFFWGIMMTSTLNLPSTQSGLMTEQRDHSERARIENQWNSNVKPVIINNLMVREAAWIFHLTLASAQVAPAQAQAVKAQSHYNHFKGNSLSITNK